MKLKFRLLFLLFILVLFIFSYLLLLVSEEFRDTLFDEEYVDPRPQSRISPKQSHKLCVIIPYRDRFEELKQFAPYMKDFLDKQKVEHHLIAVNQTDDLRFNRASLINIGWNEADRLGCDYMVMNDVDLLPINPEIPYGFPEIGIIRHITSPEYHPKYHYQKFIGGILMLTMADYKELNGMSNKYWGWGLEDDEFYLRIMEAKLNLTRVSGLSTNSTNTFRHIHGPKRKRDYSKKSDHKQWQMKRKRDRVSGLRDIKYQIIRRDVRYFGACPVVVVNVRLQCDLKWTPYCKQK
ncbi:unnamed protein product [Caenorhabditis angaria]|uniref:Uncharacterized protein n=1 Tax=Caenorhabditis angaria TaxID=860376 RepID=A0A9P1N1Q8_9PELO|nr:unnamed protein product [Caenorhabditis angaria]